MIIGVCGFIGTGKDTVADYLVNIHQYKRESFANSLKDAVATIFNWDREMLEGRTKSSRAWRDKEDKWWAKRLNRPGFTPRLALQLLGTDVLRDHFSKDIWIASLENKLRNSEDDIVITDCRFPNEIKAIKNLGGIVVRVMRGPEPVWEQDAINVNRGPDGNVMWTTAVKNMQKTGIHSSEWAWLGTKFDVLLDNNGSMDLLYQQITDLVTNPQVSKASLTS